MLLNYLPFARRQRITVPPAASGRPGRNFTRLTDFSTGGVRRAHLLDALIQQSGGEGEEGNFGRMLKVRYGINGRKYLTENLYDYRVFMNGSMPRVSVWDWSDRKRGRPFRYRIYPDQGVRLMLKYQGAQMQGRNFIVPSASFNARKTSDGSPYSLQTMLATPPQIPIGGVPPAFTPIVQAPDLILDCPHDSPIDIYGVTIGEWAEAFSRAVYILDANERPFWIGKTWMNIIDPMVAPLELGGREWSLEPDETITFEFETDDTLPAAGQIIDVTIRGVLEVEDIHG